MPAASNRRSVSATLASLNKPSIVPSASSKAAASCAVRSRNAGENADVSWSHDPDEVAQESCMQIQPVMNIANGRFRLRAVMPDYIDDPDDGILRYVSQLDIEGLDSTTLPNEDEDDDASGDATGLSDSD